MNLIYSTVLFFLLLFPGLLVRMGYFSSIYISRKIISKKPIDDLIYSLIPAILMHSAACGIVNNCSDYSIKLIYLGHFIFGDKDKTDIIFGNLKETICPILAYNINLAIIGFCIGDIFRNVVRITKADINIKFLRLSNWFYYAKGEIILLSTPNFDFHTLEYTVVDVLVKNTNETVLYTGIFKDYRIDQNGDVIYIILVKPYRKVLSNDNAEENKAIPIPTSRFMILYNTILNINFKYYTLKIKNKKVDLIPYRKLRKELIEYRTLRDIFRDLFIILLSISFFSSLFKFKLLFIICFYILTIVSSLLFGKYFIRFKKHKVKFKLFADDLSKYKFIPKLISEKEYL